MRCLIRLGVGLAGSVIGTMAWLNCAAMPVAAQNSREHGSEPSVMVSAAALPRVSQEIVREIDDPATGDRWLLERDKQQPGGPGRMMLLAPGKASPSTASGSVEHGGGESEPSASAALIHVGDHLIVEEHTKLLDASLEAIALAPARAGQTLRVRLSIGGRVVKAIAASAGCATLFPESGL